MSDNSNDRKQRNTKTSQDVLLPVPVPESRMPQAYSVFLDHLKKRIQQERLKAVLSANAALVMMYWDIGASILQKQQDEGWGTKTIDRLSHDLKKAFPEMSGFSPRNLKYMRAFADAWKDREIVQRTVAQIPWRSNIAILDTLKDPAHRLWYVQKTIENGWSRDILVFQIKSRLHDRMGRITNNFELSLPPSDSDMANQVFKDPYVFDFLGTAEPRREAELEQKLIDHLEKFQAGHVSQLNMYMNIVDDLMRHPDDKKTIGLLLVKEKNQTLAKYALQGYTNPIGVAEWEKQITTSLPNELKSSLPTVEEIEQEMGKG